MALTVRKADRSDARSLLTLVDALADYEKLPRPTEAARSRLIDDGWPESGVSRFMAWLVEESQDDGSVFAAIGYAITFFTYSSFLARPTLYLEDIFVLPGRRRDGAGTAVFSAIREEAVREGCGRIEWVVLDWNTMAQDFYRKLGAQHLEDWQCYRLPLTAD